MYDLRRNPLNYISILFRGLSASGERLFSGFVGDFQQIFPIYFIVFPKIFKKDKNSFIGRYSERLELNQRTSAGLTGLFRLRRGFVPFEFMA